MRLISLFLFIIFPALIVQSQEEASVEKSTLKLSVGLNTFGPVWKMSRLMIENDFDVTTPNWFSGSDISHPKRDPLGFTSQLSWSLSTGERRNIGFILDASYLRQVTGYSLVAEWLTVSFTSFYLAFPVFGFELSGDQEGIELQAAPLVMVNSGRETGTGQYPEKYLRVSPGLMAGAALKLWDKPVTFGELGVRVASGLPFKMGPFVAEDFWGVSDEIPESGYWFSHINFVFNLGFHM